MSLCAWVGWEARVLRRMNGLNVLGFLAPPVSTRRRIKGSGPLLVVTLH